MRWKSNRRRIFGDLVISHRDGGFGLCLYI